MLHDACTGITNLPMKATKYVKLLVCLKFHKIKFENLASLIFFWKCSKLSLTFEFLNIGRKSQENRSRNRSPVRTQTGTKLRGHILQSDPSKNLVKSSFRPSLAQEIFFKKNQYLMYCSPLLTCLGKSTTPISPFETWVTILENAGPFLPLPSFNLNEGISERVVEIDHKISCRFHVQYSEELRKRYFYVCLISAFRHTYFLRFKALSCVDV